MQITPSVTQIPTVRRWWFLSFSSTDRPKGRQFLGAALVKGYDVGDAAASAHVYNCNPGGEVLGIALPDIPEPAPEWTNRLLTKAEAEDHKTLFSGQL